MDQSQDSGGRNFGAKRPEEEALDRDGRELINVWSKGRTELGQFLSNFTHSPLRHPTYGHFASVEAFWYWLSTGKQHNELRRMYGASAKSAGMRHLPVKIPDEEFRREICLAIETKIRSHPKFLKEFINSTLPFDHYYVYGAKIVRRNRHQWQMDFLEELRLRLREEFYAPPAPSVTPAVETQTCPSTEIYQ